MIVFLLVVLVLGLWVMRRRRRASRLAGLTAAAPVFSVDPPRRRVGRLKDEAL